MDSFDDTVVLPSLGQQLGLFFDDGFSAQAFLAPEKPLAGTYFSAPEIDMSIYDKIVLCMSGGKHQNKHQFLQKSNGRKMI